MGVRSFHYGHPIHTVPNPDQLSRYKTIWVWNDTGEPLPNDPRAHGRLCPQCSRPPTPEGHDPCIANLPGVAFACCGHGVTNGYVKFEDGRIIRGFFTHVRRPIPNGKVPP